MKPIDFLPLKPAVFHILLSLADANRHGYGIMQEVQVRTGGLVKLGPGTLYTAIKRLVMDGLIMESEGTDGCDDERRRYYSITELGREVIALEAKRLEDLVDMARNKNLLSSI
ncbi:MAG: helix-turn-helix transcriptional regulator [Calothrix sp. C42_A2020_038]|nr:helix-turn-helix transcriptional regulator [Calothrix sp. C42_A2020_038]